MSHPEQMREALHKIAFEAVGMREVVEIARAALTAPAAEVPEAMDEDCAKALELAHTLKDRYGNTVPTSQAASMLRALVGRLRTGQPTRLRGGVPEGWKWVPVEPTPEMVRAAQNCPEGHGQKWHSVHKAKWAAMLTAAPQAPAAAPTPKSEPVRNNPVSALAIRILVESGRVAQADADSAFTIACEAVEQEAERMNLELPWVSRKTAPAADAVVRDAERLDWLLWKLPGDALRHCVGEISDTSSGAEFRAAIDAAMSAQAGGAK